MQSFSVFFNQKIQNVELPTSFSSSPQVLTQHTFQYTDSYHKSSCVYVYINKYLILAFIQPFHHWIPFLLLFPRKYFYQNSRKVLKSDFWIWWIMAECGNLVLKKYVLYILAMINHNMELNGNRCIIQTIHVLDLNYEFENFYMDFQLVSLNIYYWCILFKILIELIRNLKQIYKHNNE